MQFATFSTLQINQTFSSFLSHSFLEQKMTIMQPRVSSSAIIIYYAKLLGRGRMAGWLAGGWWTMLHYSFPQWRESNWLIGRVTPLRIFSIKGENLSECGMMEVDRSFVRKFRVMVWSWQWWNTGETWRAASLTQYAKCETTGEIMGWKCLHKFVKYYLFCRFRILRKIK